MEKQVKVYVKSVYGKVHIYPANQTAEAFATLIGTKTLSEGDLKIIQALGFEVVQVDAYKLNLSNAKE